MTNYSDQLFNKIRKTISAHNRKHPATTETEQFDYHLQTLAVLIEHLAVNCAVFEEMALADQRQGKFDMENAVERMELWRKVYQTPLDQFVATIEDA